MSIDNKTIIANDEPLSDDDKLYIINKLRAETGWGMMDCKRALRESNWKIDDAKAWLIQYSKKPGILFN